MTKQSNKKPVGIKIKPQLKVKKHQLWVEECGRIYTIIEKFEAMTTMNGEKWRQGMIKHWRAKLDEIVEREPKRGT